MIYLFRSKKEDYTLRQQYIPTGATELDLKVYYYNDNGILQTVPIFIGKIYGVTGWTVPLTELLSSLFDKKLTKPVSYNNYALALPTTLYFSAPSNLRHYLIEFYDASTRVHQEHIIYANNTNIMSLDGIDHPEMDEASLRIYNNINGNVNSNLYTGLRMMTIPCDYTPAYIEMDLYAVLHYKDGTVSGFKDTDITREFPIWFSENNTYTTFCEICIDRAMFLTSLQGDYSPPIDLSQVAYIDVYLVGMDDVDTEHNRFYLCSFNLLDTEKPPIFKSNMYQLVYYTLDGVFTSIYCTGSSSSNTNCKMQSYMDSKGIKHNFYGTNEEAITVNTGLLTDAEAKFIAGLPNSQTVFIRPIEYRCDNLYPRGDGAYHEGFIPIQYYTKKKNTELGRNFIDWQECTVTSQFKSHRYRDNRKFSQYTINLKLNNVQNTI